MKAVGRCTVGPSQAGASRCSHFALAALLAVACGTAGAWEEGPHIEVNTSSLPRFDNIDGATRTSRVDMTLMPQQRSGLGLAVGISSLSGPSLSGLAPPPAGSPSVDLGLHWRYTMDSNQRVDVTAWRRVPPADALSLIHSREPTYGARVELPLRSGSSKALVADRGFVGLQLEGGARITVKRRHGGPMFYYRNKF